MACAGATQETGQRQAGAQSSFLAVPGACSLQQAMAQVSVAGAGEKTGVAGAIGAKAMASKAGMTRTRFIGGKLRLQTAGVK